MSVIFMAQTKWNGKTMKYLKDIVNDWIEGTFPVEEKQKPFVWKKNKMSYDLWKAIMGFMLHSQTTRKAEAQIRLYYNDTLGQWSAMPLPQYPSGMTTKEEVDHPMEKEIRKAAKMDHPDWVNLGTVHHHCTAGAFASSTDKDNEADQDGLHITIGNMDKSQTSLHVRFTCQGKTTDLKEHELTLFVDLEEQMAKYLLQFPDVVLAVLQQNGTHEFPEYWKKALLERPVPANNYGYFSKVQQPPFCDDSKKKASKKKNKVSTTKTNGSDPQELVEELWNDFVSYCYAEAPKRQWVNWFDCEMELVEHGAGHTKFLKYVKPFMEEENYDGTVLEMISVLNSCANLQKVD